MARLHPRQFVGEIGIFHPVRSKERAPILAGFAVASEETTAEVLGHAFRHEELRLFRPAVAPLREADFVLAEGLAMRSSGILLVRRPVTYMAVEHDKRRAISFAAELVDRLGDSLAVIGVAHMLDIPAIGEEPRSDIVAKGEFGTAFDRHTVIVINPEQVSELQMAGDRGGFAGHTLHHVAVAAEHIDAVVEQRELRPVEPFGEEARGDCHADRIAAALTEWSTPPVWPHSGCPGQRLLSCRKRLMSSRLTAGPVILPSRSICLMPAKNRTE